MKYVVLIIDGAAGWGLERHGGRTCLELARTPNLDAMAKEGVVGLVRTVPEGMEPSSACACMSVLGYDPRIYYRGRSAIEAVSLGIPIAGDEVVFRCNLVTVQDGRMRSYSAGHISSDEARLLISALNDRLGSDEVRFYPGVRYRHICKIKGHPEALLAECTPPHDIPDQPVAGYLPKGRGSGFLRELMMRSRAVLEEHEVNRRRQARGEPPATMVWLFWGAGQIPEMPPFRQVYGLKAALTSGVDLLRGLAKMAGMTVLDIPGVTDGLDNDYAGQLEGALKALEGHDLVAVHVEAPDEAAHVGSVEEKVKAIERVDGEMVARLRRGNGPLRVLVLPDHPTPIQLRTHTDEPVPFVLWGDGFASSGAVRFTEAEAGRTGIFLGEGYNIMAKLLRG